MVATSVAQLKDDPDCFDPSAIDSMAGIMSTNVLRSLLGDVVRDVSLRLERLAEVQIAPGSLSLIVQDAHDLRSMGGNFGLSGMSTCAATVERAARGNSIDSVRAAMPSLIKMGRRSIKTLANRYEIHCERTQ